MILKIEYDKPLKNANFLRKFLLSELEYFRLKLEKININKSNYSNYFWEKQLEKIPIATTNEFIGQEVSLWISPPNNYFWLLNEKCVIDTNNLPIFKDFEGSFSCSFKIVKGKPKENVNFSLINSIGIIEENKKIYFLICTERKSLDLKNLFLKYKDMF